jgi:hypothetical protein
MAELETPPRWLDQDAELPRELLEGLRGCAEDAPSSVQRARMQENLLRGVASATSPAGNALVKLGAFSLVVGCTLGALWWWNARWPAGPAPAGPARPLASEAAPAVPAPAATAAPSAEPETLMPASADASLEPVAPDLTARPPAASPHLKAGRAPAGKPPPHVDAAGELELLTRARRALGSAPERSLALVAEHARTYHEGTFAQERELLGIEALVKLQRMDEARLRAARFARRYPRSAHLPRLDVLVGPQ